MICKHCKEQINLGDACITVKAEGRTNYYHPFCSTYHNPVRELEEAKNEDAEFERIAQQARNVC